MNAKQPYIVIDLNAMAEEALDPIADRCRDQQLELMIPDGAFFEMSKGSRPRETWRRSLQCLVPYRDFVCVSRKLAAMMKEELSDGDQCTGIVDQTATKYVRAMLSELAIGKETLLSQIMLGPMVTLMPESRSAWEQHDQNKAMVKALCDSVSNMLTRVQLGKLRRSPDTELAKWVSSVQGIRFVFQRIHGRTGHEQKTYQLASQRSVTGGFYSTLFALASHWLAFCGIESAKAQKLTNDLHDIDYVVLGSLSTDLVTEDQRAKRIHGCVVSGFDARTAWFRNERAFGPEVACVMSGADTEWIA